MRLEKIELGKVYRDKISGFTGVAISQTEFLYACKRIGLQPKEMKDGKPIDSCYFDIFQLEEVEEIEGLEQNKKKKKTGGPGECAKPLECPKR